MTTTAEEVTADEWAEAFAEPEKTEAVPGPLTGSRGTRSTTGTRRRRTGVKKLETLQKKLSQEMFQAGAMIGMGLNTTGLYICQESDAFTRAVIDLAATRPEWVDALENIANIQPGIVIGRTFIGIGASVAVDRGRADPEKNVMKLLGVYSAWKKMQDNSYEMVEGSAYSPPPAGTFSPLS